MQALIFIFIAACISFFWWKLVHDDLARGITNLHSRGWKSKDVSRKKNPVNYWFIMSINVLVPVLAVVLGSIIFVGTSF